MSITASSPVIVAETIQAADITILSTDGATAGDDIIIRNGVTVRSTAGNVILRSGDNVTLESGSTVTAAGNIEIHGDFGDADAGVGSIIDLHGTLSALAVKVFGGNDNDLVIIPGIDVGTEVRTANGNDRIFVGSNANATANTGGVLSGIKAVLDIAGGPHSTGDALVLDDSGNTGVGGGSLTAGSVSGFGMTGRIDYIEIENMGVALGSGDNTINIAATVAGTTTTLTGGAGNDTFNISSDPYSSAGTLDGIRGDLVLLGGGGINTINLNDQGNTSGRTAVITGNSIIGMTGDAGGSGIITFAASDGFSGGINILNGSGGDTLTVGNILPGTATIIRGGRWQRCDYRHGDQPGSERIVGHRRRRWQRHDQRGRLAFRPGGVRRQWNIHPRCRRIAGYRGGQFHLHRSREAAIPSSPVAATIW